MYTARLIPSARLARLARVSTPKICRIPAGSACRGTTSLSLVSPSPVTVQRHAISTAPAKGLAGSRATSIRMASAASEAAEAPKAVLVPIAHGTEEMEAVIIVDVLRRAGAEVVVASVEDSLTVNCSRQVKLQADESITTAVRRHYDLVALPGGMPGAERLRDCGPLEQLLRDHVASGKHYAAICATPAVFFAAKGLIGESQKATAHPAFSDKLQNQSAVNERVVIDGRMTTSRGPGTAFEFALSLVKQLYGEEKMKAVAGPMVMYAYTV